MNILFSHAFCSSWRNLLKDTFQYKERKGFIKQNCFLFRSIYSYLPLLPYTDITDTKLQRLKEIPRKRSQHRILDFNETQFANNDPVTMRLELDGVSADKLWSSFHSKARQHIRKSVRSNLNTKIEIGDDKLCEFYVLYCKTVHRLGSPPLPLKLFLNLKKHCSYDLICTYKEDLLIAALIVIYDKHIALSAWAAFDKNYASFYPNYSLFWSAIQLALKKNKQIFDFGRSPYNENSFHFKKQWGAIPVRIKLLTKENKEFEVYSKLNKYRLMINMWKYLPFKVANWIGPYFVRFVIEL